MQLSIVLGCGGGFSSARDADATRRYVREREAMIRTLRSAYAAPRAATDERWASIEARLRSAALNEHDINMCGEIRYTLEDLTNQYDVDVRPIQGGPCVGWIPDNPFSRAGTDVC